MEKIRKAGVNGLKWLESYIKTDMVYLAKGGFWAIFSQIIVSTSTLLLAMAFAHFISKETYGQYKYILSIGAILSTFTLTGLGTAVLRSVNRGFEGTLNYAFWKNIKWSMLSFLLTLSLAVYYFVHGNTGLGTAMLVVGAFSPFFSSTNLYNSFLAAKKDFRRSAIYYSIIGNLFPAFCIFIALLTTNKPFWLVVVYFVSNTLIGVILYIRVVKIYQPNKKIDNESINYSKHLSLMNILGTIVDNIDQVLIFHYIGPVQLAIYNFAVAIPSQIKGPIKGLSGLILPKFIEREDGEIRSGMKNKILVLFISALIIIGSYIIVAPYIYHIFFPKYVDSILYSQIFSISLLSMIAMPADTYMLAKEKIKEQYIAIIGGFIIQISVLYVGIVWGGLMGFVLAQPIIKILWALQSIALYEYSSRKAVSLT